MSFGKSLGEVLGKFLKKKLYKEGVSEPQIHSFSRLWRVNISWKVIFLKLEIKLLPFFFSSSYPNIKPSLDVAEAVILDDD